MVYRAELKNRGITICISSDRKHGNGAVGGGRKNTSGKKAVVSVEGSENVILRGSTTTALLSAVRRQFNIPHNVKINRKGETRI